MADTGGYNFHVCICGDDAILQETGNLWMFVLTAFCSMPVNWFFLTNFEIWKNVLYSGEGNSILTLIVIIEYAMI